MPVQEQWTDRIEDPAIFASAGANKIPYLPFAKVGGKGNKLYPIVDWLAVVGVIQLQVRAIGAGVDGYADAGCLLAVPALGDYPVLVLVRPQVAPFLQIGYWNLQNLIK